MVHSPDFEKKRLAIGAVIDYNQVHHPSYSRIQVFKHFGVSVATGYTWFPISSTDGPRRGRPKGESKKAKSKAPSLKRTLSEDPEGEIFSPKIEPDEAPAQLLQKPVPDGRRGQKRFKVTRDEAVEKTSPASSLQPISPPSTLDGSLSPPKQLATPPKRGQGRPTQQRVSGPQHQGERTESITKRRREVVNDDFSGQV